MYIPVIIRNCIRSLKLKISSHSPHGIVISVDFYDLLVYKFSRINNERDTEVNEIWSHHLDELGDRLNQDGDKAGYLRMVNRNHIYNSSNYSLSSLFRYFRKMFTFMRDNSELHRFFATISAVSSCVIIKITSNFVPIFSFYNPKSKNNIVSRKCYSNFFIIIT